MQSFSPVKLDHLIDNADVSASQYAPLHDPGRVTDVVGMIAQGDAQVVDAAVRSAHAAFHSWRATSYEERAALLRAIADLLEAEAGSVVEIMARESGMLVATNKAEIGMAANIVRDNAEAGAEFLKPHEVSDAESWVSVEKRPIGVIAAIVPWNAPIILAMRKVAPALICGNTVVVKPAPTAPIGLSMLLKKAAALLPPGVINIVHGGGEVGHALTTHPMVGKVSFTGGGAVARHIMKAAADSIKGVQFELGGNDPSILLDDANLDDAIAKIIGGAFRRSGQFCFAVKRVYAPASLYREVVARLEAETDKFSVGYPLDPGVNFGPINNKGQFEFLQGLLERTKASGATVHELGKVAGDSVWSNGYYMRPAVVSDIDPEAELVQVEQFGPLLPVVKYDNLDDVIDSINAGELGLGSSLWTADFDKALAVARRIEAGMTFINNVGTSRLGQKNIPFGGVKQSGIGRESSPIGLREYVEYHALNYHK
ncbi:aldehyde dehydrogenase family protein [Rhizobium sp. RU36D]|uniref:aldehyde dehydrogenase family protein n=1 Tax=Rhizobium sp. RU36D TaxID=1907415 RepID=UPI0009D7CD22|nr:aldehyde dehydrogenase family protein [Rhizobium sp. RU36D]SMD12741.1 aldehyde dehydrogenase [Rhizobium sp. RU36D]